MPIITAQADLDRPEAVEFYRRLGMCVTSWAFVDRCLYQVFHHAVGLEQKQSALFYYGDRTFSRRLDLIDRALRDELSNQEFVEEWRPLRDATRDLSHTRNIIVHQPTLRTATSINGVSLEVYEIYIEPYERILNNDYSGLRGKETMGIEDLQAHEKDVGELHGKLSTFAWKMGGRRAAMGSGQ